VRVLIEYSPSRFAPLQPDGSRFATVAEAIRHYDHLIREAVDPEARKELKMQRRNAIADIREHEANQAAIEAGLAPPL
jgi:hypothetical protein